MQGRTAARVAWSLFGLAGLLFVSGAILWSLAAPFGSLTVPAALITRSAALVTPAMGALIAARRPANPVGWLLLGAGVVGALVQWAYDWALYPTGGLSFVGNALPGQHAVRNLAIGALGFTWTFVPFIFLLFPNGRLPSRRWRPLAGITLATFLFLNVMVAFTTEGPSFGPVQPNELAVAEYYGTDTLIGALVFSAFWVAVALLVLSPFSVVVRFRHAHGEERLQLKWASLGATIFAINLLVVPTINTSLAGHPLAVTVVNYVVYPLFLAAFPAAIAVAILRYRLYDIDLILDPGVEAAVYFCCLEALQNVARHAGEVPVIVELTRDDGNLVFSVTDSGPGFDPASRPHGRGLQNMADRVAALSGTFDICSNLMGAGTTVRGRIPLELSADDS